MQKKSIIKKPFKLLCQLLIALAPLAASNTACFLLWGEPECPNSIKSSLPTK